MKTRTEIYHSYWHLFVGVCFIALFSLHSCEDPEHKDKNSFDRKDMLTHLADQYILPGFEDVTAKAKELEEAINDFTANPNLTQLATCQELWHQAYMSFMMVNSFNFGPAAESGTKKSMVEEIGTWPVNVSLVETRVQEGNLDFTNFDRDARGFLAMEYLLFPLSKTKESLVSEYQSSTNRRQYLQALANHSTSYLEAVLASWRGDFRSAFIQNNGTSIGSSISEMYNEFVKSFEAVKNFKLGLPLGLRAGQMQTEPQRVEALYSGNSFQYMRKHIEALESIWTGVSPNAIQGNSWKQYLEASPGGADLVSMTENQIMNYTMALDQVDTTQVFTSMVSSNDPQLISLHTELQKHIRFYKSDMSSLLGITITFSSNDGD